MTEPESGTDELNRFVTVLSNSVTYVVNEAFVLAQYEAAQDDSFAKLWAENQGEAFDKRMNQAVEHLGGPPEFYLLKEGQKPPPADNYPEAAMREAFDVFNRTRKSVVRAHMFMTGCLVVDRRPDLFDLSEDPERAELFSKQAEIAFWEHAEAAYIRLYSFWDRIGQVLDFAFFNIRKFDQNGFTAVMDRIHKNAVPMDDRFKHSSSWQRLRSFQTSEKEDGLKWLLERRNLVVHSLHLHPVESDEEGMFNSQFNHLDATHRNRLRPRKPEDEVKLLMRQLDKVGNLFSDFLAVINLAPSRNRKSYE